MVQKNRGNINEPFNAEAMKIVIQAILKGVDYVGEKVSFSNIKIYFDIWFFLKTAEQLAQGTTSSYTQFDTMDQMVEAIVTVRSYYIKLLSPCFYCSVAH
jgi:hypothetical protein